MFLLSISLLLHLVIMDFLLLTLTTTLVIKRKVTRSNQFSVISPLKKEDKNISEHMFYEDDLMQSK